MSQMNKIALFIGIIGMMWLLLSSKEYFSPINYNQPVLDNQFPFYPDVNPGVFWSRTRRKHGRGVPIVRNPHFDTTN